MAIKRPGNRGNNQTPDQTWGDPGTTLDWDNTGSGKGNGSGGRYTGGGSGGRGAGGSGRGSGSGSGRNSGGSSGGWNGPDDWETDGRGHGGSLVLPVVLGCIAAVIIFGGVVLFQIIKPRDPSSSTTAQNNPSSIVNGNSTGQATSQQTNSPVIQIQTPETGSTSGTTSSGQTTPETTTSTTGNTSSTTGNTSNTQTTPATPETGTTTGNGSGNTMTPDTSSSTTGNTGTPDNGSTGGTTPAIVISPQGDGTTGTTSSGGTVLTPDTDSSTTGRTPQQGTTSGTQAGNTSTGNTGSTSTTSQADSGVNSGLYRDGSNDPTGYILPESATKVLTESDLSNLTVKGICYAKNELYARYGRRFKADELTNYFNSKSWYSPKYEAGAQDSYIVDNLMNSYEKQNISILQDAENRLGGYSF